MNEYGVALFYTNSAVMQAEAILVRAGLAIKLLPTPRELSSDCGVALRFEWDQIEEVRALLAKGRVETQGIHPMPVRSVNR
jgi:hypothetical protein